MTDNSDIVFSYQMSDHTLLKALGEQLKQMRLNKNWTQKQLSEISGLSRSTISDIESGSMGTVLSLIQILRALEKIEILNSFIHEAPVSPIQIAKLKGKRRQRASGKGYQPNDKEESEW